VFPTEVSFFPLQCDSSVVASSDNHPSEWFIAAVTVYVWCYPILWMLGLAGFWWFGTFALSITFAAATKFKHFPITLLLVPICILISIPIGILNFGFSNDRILSVVANCFVWFSVAALMAATRMPSYSQRLDQGVMFITLVQGVFIILALVKPPLMASFPLLQQYAPYMPGSSGSFATNQLIYTDWLGQATLRSQGIMGHATWCGAIGVIGGLIALRCPLHAEDVHRITNWSVVFRILTILACGVSLYFSLSRWTIVSLLIGLVVAFSVQCIRRVPSILFFVLALVMLNLVLLLIHWDYFLALLETLNNAREGSYDSRSDIYDTTISLVAQLGLPIIGYGIKPSVEGLVANVATHSTYLGLLFRGGILATLFFVVFLAYTIRQNVKHWGIISITLWVFVAVWSVFEDFDPGHLVPLGLILCRPKD